jgi:hypothetical protein
VVTRMLQTAAPGRPRRPVALLPERIRAVRRPKWWQEIIFIAVCYWLYAIVRNAVPDHQVAAGHRALDVLGAEGDIGIAVERDLNAFVSGHDWLAYICNYYYATLHFVVTIGVLVWLYRRHPLRYRSLRSVLFATNIVALIGFYFYALAPPRLLEGHGYVDTIVAFNTWGSWGSADVDAASNQYAAMPSLHIGWAVWCAVVIWMLARRPWVRALGVVYPLMTLFVIVGTANHFVLDAAGGLLVLALGFGVQRLLSGRPAFAPPTITLPDQPPGGTR